MAQEFTLVALARNILPEVCKHGFKVVSVGADMVRGYARTALLDAASLKYEVICAQPLSEDMI